MDQQEETEPNQLIIQFLDKQPTAARHGIYHQVAFYLVFLLDPHEKDRLLSSAADVGEAKLKRLLSNDGLTLVGATVSVVALIDLAFGRFVNAEASPELEQSLIESRGSADLARRHVRDSADKWFELRDGPLSFDALLDFSERATAYREPPPINVTGSTI
jgi:hypothetical protein